MYRLFLALRWLGSRPINLLGIAGVAVSVWALIVVVSIFSGFLREVRGHLQAATSDLTVLRLPWPSSFARLERVLARDPEVAASAPRVVWYGLLHAFGKRKEVLPQMPVLDQPGAESPFVSLVGVDPSRESAATGWRSWLAKVEDPRLRPPNLDDPLAPIDGRPAILLSERRVQHEFIGRGATIKITSGHLTGNNGAQQLEPLDQQLALAGAYSTRHHGFDNGTCFVHIDTLRGLMASDVADLCTEIVVRVAHPERATETAARLQRAINADLRFPHQEVLVRTWEELHAIMLDAVDHQRSLMKLVLFVILVVAAFLMYATLSMMVAEKTHDIGILTAMGATPGGVLRVFLACGLSIVIAGIGLGTLGGCVTSYYLNDFNEWIRAAFGVDLFPTRIYNLERVPYDLDPLWIAQVAAMALGVGVVVSGWPAWSAARQDPVAALRNE